MKKTICWFLTMLLVCGTVAGCASRDTNMPAPESQSGSRGENPDSDTGEPKASEKSNRNLSILWSSGGNGEFVNYTVDFLKEQYGLTVDIEYNAKAHEVFQPQLIAGNPPDIVMVQHSFFNYYEAIRAGAFQDISSYLSLPVNGSDKTIREVANPSIIEGTSVDGKTYLLMSNMNIGGLYYNQAMFDEHGWSVPETWDEFISLCETIKTTTDIAPFAYPGMYPYYMNCFIFPQFCTLGNGMETFKDYNNMKEGFWISDPVKESMERIQYMRDNGYFLDKLTSLSHTETQMEFINGNVAILACGSWLENEMASNWPDDFQLAYMPTPAGDTADAEQFVVASGNMFGFPTDAANSEWTGEFLQTYYSDESAICIAQDCGVVISPSMVVETEEIRSSLPDSVVKTYEAANDATILYSLASIWYAEFWTNYQNTLAAFVAGDMDADEFCRMMEDFSETIRNDDSIEKYTIS